MTNGLFISVEGGEGSGKTTQLAMLMDTFKSSGIPVISTREPGGTPAAEQIRELLVRGAEEKWHPVAETLLFYAARVEHCERVIKPALVSGTHVICDRFIDSTLVYQGIAKAQGEEFIRTLHRMTLGNFMPDITLYLDIDPEKGLARAKGRGGEETRFESASLHFHRKVREGFLHLAQAEPSRIIIVNADDLPQAVHRSIITALNSNTPLTLTAK